MTNELAYACRFPFGKHKGETLQQVFEEDPEYLGWCVRNNIRFVTDNLTRDDREIVEICYQGQDDWRDFDESPYDYEGLS